MTDRPLFKIVMQAQTRNGNSIYTIGQPHDFEARDVDDFVAAFDRRALLTLRVWRWNPHRRAIEQTHETRAIHRNGVASIELYTEDAPA